MNQPSPKPAPVVPLRETRIERLRRDLHAALDRLVDELVEKRLENDQAEDEELTIW